MPFLNNTKKILFIDNFDSFSQTIVYYLKCLTCEVYFAQKNQDLKEFDLRCLEKDFSHLIISPGPGKPKEAKFSNLIISKLAGKLPILGICLGHQCIAELYGAQVIKTKALKHGAAQCNHLTKAGKNSKLFSGLPTKFNVARYNSLIIDESTLDAQELIVSSSLASENGNLIMSVEHKYHLNLFGIQFHPESIISEYGQQILQNFIEL